LIPERHLCLLLCVFALWGPAPSPAWSIQSERAAVFGGVKVLEREGYWVFLAEKRREEPAKKQPKPPSTLSRKLRRRQERKGRH